MRLTGDRMLRLEQSLQLALDQEWPQLNRAGRRLARLKPIRIPPLSSPDGRLPAIATVATDGGENRLNLAPLRLEVVRVADSLGEVYFEEFVARSLAPDEIFHFFFQSHPPLKRFLDYLRVDWKDLLPRSDFQSSQLLSMLRELMEWAALLKLASRPPARLLIRDGLLRSVLLTESVFGRLVESFEALTSRHGHFLVGVAKRSSVVNYLTVALGLGESLAAGEPAYLPIPVELEREAAPAQYRWVGSRAMVSLHIARLDFGESVPLLPVDIAAWQREQVGEVMALLHDSARASFPIRGYPRALTEAHDHARLGRLEIELLTTLLLEQVRERDPNVARQARQWMLLDRELVEEAADDAPVQS